MRSVSRNNAPVPAVIAADGIGAKETEKAIAFYTASQPNTTGTKQKKKAKGFPFTVYKHPSIKGVLEAIFHGKCAYCEDRYAGGQPVDIEHWRPKGEVIIGDDAGVRSHGYYWLAASWENLLPSCIDCNRVREHLDFVDNTRKTLGKGNWFPVADENRRNRAPNEAWREEPLLINPCLDEPSAFLLYHEEGFVSAKTDESTGKPNRKAEASIRFYALNRSELVHERRARILLMKHRMDTISRLAGLLQHKSMGNNVKDAIEDLLSHELNNLNNFQDPKQPFSAMARQLIDEFIEKFRV